LLLLLQHRFATRGGLGLPLGQNLLQLISWQTLCDLLLLLWTLLTAWNGAGVGTSNSSGGCGTSCSGSSLRHGEV
jgi:hypothetical protein